jgi:hypothetical protein
VLNSAVNAPKAFSGEHSKKNVSGAQVKGATLQLTHPVESSRPLSGGGEKQGTF